MISRGQIWWADFGEPSGSEPGYRRPVVIVQADSFNRSALRTVLAVPLSSNEKLAGAPGNVSLPARATRLDKDSVANVSQLSVLDRSRLTELVSHLSARLLAQVDDGLRLILDV